MDQHGCRNSGEKCLNSISKLLEQELSSSKYDPEFSKESTSEEFYEELLKHKSSLRQENFELRRQI